MIDCQLGQEKLIDKPEFWLNNNLPDEATATNYPEGLKTSRFWRLNRRSWLPGKTKGGADPEDLCSGSLSSGLPHWNGALPLEHTSGYLEVLIPSAVELTQEVAHQNTPQSITSDCWMTGRFGSYLESLWFWELSKWAADATQSSITQ